MLIALIAKDKEGSIEVRKANRDAHLAYLKSSDGIAQAGPLLSDAGDMIGSLIILDLPSVADAQNWANADPYAEAGLFQSVELIEWKRVIG
jgi:uncharacterized protein YciI